MPSKMLGSRTNIFDDLGSIHDIIIDRWSCWQWFAYVAYPNYANSTVGCVPGDSRIWARYWITTAIYNRSGGIEVHIDYHLILQVSNRPNSENDVPIGNGKHSR